mmetsp:Transcript_18176/g.45992  ORF Transcript_18176/g.45992 Transcript_18176/m.45992 type:complete len:285 (-) Transcript_18176:225-1079(-)
MEGVLPQEQRAVAEVLRACRHAPPNRSNHGRGGACVRRGAHPGLHHATHHLGVRRQVGDAPQQALHVLEVRLRQQDGRGAMPDPGQQNPPPGARRQVGDGRAVCVERRDLDARHHCCQHSHAWPTRVGLAARADDVTHAAANQRWHLVAPAARHALQQELRREVDVVAVRVDADEQLQQVRHAVQLAMQPASALRHRPGQAFLAGRRCRELKPARLRLTALRPAAEVPMAWPWRRRRDGVQAGPRRDRPGAEGQRQEAPSTPPQHRQQQLSHLLGDTINRCLLP